MKRTLRLGVNIDHVATIRNARGGRPPDPVRGGRVPAPAGGGGAPAPLRRETALPLNLEMAATAEMLEIALEHRPHAACLVPEKREERTTEGGLDAAGGRRHLAPYVQRPRDAGLRVSMFVETPPAP